MYLQHFTQSTLQEIFETVISFGDVVVVVVVEDPQPFHIFDCSLTNDEEEHSSN